MNSLKYTLLLPIVSFLACDTQVIIPIPSEANKPVINVLMNKDSIIYARITLSGRVVNPDNFVEPKDAVVQLFDNDQLKETLVRRKVDMRDYYCSTTKMEAGHTYRVTAAIPGHALAEGTDAVPDSVVTGELKHIEVAVNGAELENKVVIELKDKAGERNYYRIRIYGAYKQTLPDGTTVVTPQNYPVYFKSDDPAMDLFGDGRKQTFFTDDRLFDGRMPRFAFTLDNYGQFELLVAEITTLTHDSYRYLQTSYVASLKFEDPLSEKVLVYNNIKNGLGIVGGVAVKRYFLPK